MSSIREIRLVDILPPNIAQDGKVRAAAEALDRELQAVTAVIDQCLLLCRIDELPESVLDLLAWQFHVDFYEADLPIEQKRVLVKKAFAWHKRKGTVAVVEEAVRSIFGRAKVEEWYEYGGDPYKFRIEVDIDTYGATKETLARLDRLIQVVKNRRSWLEVVNMYLTGYCRTSVGSSTVAGEEATVYPWSITEVEGKGLIRMGVGYQAVEMITVYPEEV